MNFAYLSDISLDRNSDMAIYIQLKLAICDLIKKGILMPGVKLPSSRQFAIHLKLHRQTIVAALEELKIEEWIVTNGRKGTFVNKELPQIKPRSLGGLLQYPSKAQFSIRYNNTPIVIPTSLYGFDDGWPDARIAPVEHLANAFQEVLLTKSKNRSLSRNQHPFGSYNLRDAIANELSLFRGLPITADNVFITQGTQMTFFILGNILLEEGDNVIVTTPNYLNANHTFEKAGARLLNVGCDNQGMNVEDVEAICKLHRVRFVYVTPHHHDPTTVSMASDRRKKLLTLAEEHGFAIIEDDYDYHYHYENKPVMPIASLDKSGHVIYMGSFAKILSHNLRLAYVVAPIPLINSMAVCRNTFDRYGDIAIEEAVAKLMKNNVLENHIRKSLVVYRQRRNFSYHLIMEELSSYLRCKLPEGGLAFWTEFEKTISLPKVSEKCRRRGLYFPDGTFYNSPSNGCRMGFASMNSKEMVRAIDILNSELRNIKSR